MVIPEHTTLVRCASHRARDKLFRITGRIHGWFSWDTACTGGFYPVPDTHLPEALRITGCSRASSRFTYQPCWYG